MFKKGYHLTYCTNIHPGESWDCTFVNLKKYIPSIKKELAENTSFGIGLRLSNEASLELMEDSHLQDLKVWLENHNCYVFTLNGFPYGGFHGQVVKDEVHQPDWTTAERKDYTLRLFDILAYLLPNDMDGGISTSPLSYKHWHSTGKGVDFVWKKSSEQLAEVTAQLYKIKKDTGKNLHLDIEPEPDGMLENSTDVITFFKEWLLPVGTTFLMQELGISASEAESSIKEHIRICYDICHFAVMYEKHEEVLKAFEKEGIKIGKIQISAALMVSIPGNLLGKVRVEKLLLPFVESTYLHQVVGRMPNGAIKSYPDLPDALVSLAETDEEEWRIHFHVPIFLEEYGELSPTQQDILSVMKYIQANKITNHLEVETYTWEVLPENINLDLRDSISRELQWVIQNLNQG